MKKFISFKHKEPYWGIKRGIFTGDNKSLLAQHCIKKHELDLHGVKIIDRCYQWSTRLLLKGWYSIWEQNAINEPIYLPDVYEAPGHPKWRFPEALVGQLGLSFIWGYHNLHLVGMISRSANYFITCYTVQTRPNKIETAVHGCNSWLSVCPVCPLIFPRSISLASLYSSLLKHSFTFVRHLSWRKL